MAVEELNRPPYAEMIFAAIDSLKENEGSSISSISTCIDSTCVYLPDEHINILTDNLNQMVDNGELVVLNGKYMRSEVATPAKRGRGRPPKAGAQGRVSDPATGSIEQGSEVKRGRGRPKKNPNAPPAPKKVKVSGRGRGRPRKDGKVQPELAGVEAN